MQVSPPLQPVAGDATAKPGRRSKPKRTSELVSRRRLTRIRIRRLARKISGPRRQGLAGKGFEEYPSAVGVSGARRQSETSAPFRRHRVLQAKRLVRRPPPPGRGRRPHIVGGLAPKHE